MSLVPPVVARDWKLKLSAFGLAVLFWIWAVVDTAPGNTNTMVNVPVSILLADSSWALVSPPEPTTVEVHFAGSLAVARALSRGGASVEIPIRSVGSPDTMVTISRDWVVTSGGASVIVTEIVPPAVHLRFEEGDTEVVPLWIRTTGELPEGQALSKALGLEPQVISVSGAASQVRALDSIPTEPLDLSEVSTSGRYFVPIDTTALSGLRLSVQTARIDASVETEERETLPIVRVVLDASAQVDSALLSIEPANVLVTLWGGVTPLGQVDPIDVRAVIAPNWLTGMVPGEVRSVPLSVLGVPPLVRAEVRPDTVLVRRRLEDDTNPGGGEGR